MEARSTWASDMILHQLPFTTTLVAGSVNRRRGLRSIAHSAADDQQKQQAQVTAVEADKLDLPFESEIKTYNGGSTGGTTNSSSANYQLGPSKCTQVVGHELPRGKGAKQRNHSRLLTSLGIRSMIQLVDSFRVQSSACNYGSLLPYMC